MAAEASTPQEVHGERDVAVNEAASHREIERVGAHEVCRVHRLRRERSSNLAAVRERDCPPWAFNACIAVSAIRRRRFVVW